MPLRLSRAWRAAAAFAVVLTTVTVVVVAWSVPPAAAATAPAPAPAEPSTAPSTWPVDAPLVDRFRPPATPYSPGNRGIDFDTTVGQPVVAAAPGEVVFAGRVGHTLHVVLLHAGGLRTSYSFLHRVDVRRGQTVERGGVIGQAGDTFHFGLRAGAAYLDPLVFLRLRPGLPYLVKDDPRPLVTARLLAGRHPRPLRAHRLLPTWQ